MSILKSGARSNLARVGITVAAVAAAVGGLATSASATNPAMTLSATTGPVTGANTLTLTIASTATTKFSSGNIGVVFSASTATGAAAANCPGTSATSNLTTSGLTQSATTATAGTLIPNSTGNVRYLATTKASIVVPDLRFGSAVGPTTWLVCAYNKAASGNAIASGATLIGKAVYTVALAPEIDDHVDHSGSGGTDFSASSNLGVTPASGPAFGGQTVTIYGANFPTTISSSSPLTATLGGVPMTGITAGSASYFTAVTPPHVASSSPVSLTVTTNGGTATWTAAFTYKNGITVSPSTVVSGQSVDVDIQGVGFSSLTFVSADTSGVSSGDGTAAGTNANTPHVYLVPGTYDRTSYASGVNKTKGQSAECINPVVISDTELICTVDAGYSVDSTTSAGTYSWSTTDLANGTYTVTVVDKGSAAPTYQTVLSSGATFTVADF
ncbi:MAG TPA: IPT/TIG domain-containing protein [Kineosporiaceae bacterium]